MRDLDCINLAKSWMKQMNIKDVRQAKSIIKPMMNLCKDGNISIEIGGDEIKLDNSKYETSKNILRGLELIDLIEKRRK